MLTGPTGNRQATATTPQLEVRVWASWVRESSAGGLMMTDLENHSSQQNVIVYLAMGSMPGNKASITYFFKLSTRMNNERKARVWCDPRMTES